ncbi:unnamed protein product [Urochloa humidicola]
MAAPAPTAITSLHHAVLLSTTHEGPLVVFVRSVHLRDAPALLELLVELKRSPPGWQLDRNQELRHLARIVNEMAAIQDVVFPLLKEDPLDQDAMRLLRRYAWSLRHVAIKVDGPKGDFYKLVQSVGLLLGRHVDHIAALDRSPAWLLENVDTMTERVEALKPILVALPDHDGDGDDDEGAAGGKGKELAEGPNSA